MVSTLTDDIISKLVLCDVVKQGGENWEEGDGGVVNVLGHAFDLLMKRRRTSLLIITEYFEYFKHGIFLLPGCLWILCPV